jgi:hypothetical protein
VVGERLEPETRRSILEEPLLAPELLATRAANEWRNEHTHGTVDVVLASRALATCESRIARRTDASSSI